MNIPGVFSLISFNGIEPYKLVTSRLQNPCILLSILFKKLMNSSVFLRWDLTWLRSGFNELTKYFDKAIAGVSVAE